jgi:Fanconi anemia group M protein
MPFYNIFEKRKQKQEKELNVSEIIIDSREKSSLVPSILIGKKAKIHFETLEIGDYLINNTIIERKTFSDFQSSIINKRLFKQLEEMKKYSKQLLIVEGKTKKDEFLHTNAIKGMLLSCLLEYQIPILFSEDEEDTSNFLLVLAKKSPPQISLRHSRSDMNKKERKQFILEGFEGIGPATARQLIKENKTLRNIFTKSKEDLEKQIKIKSRGFDILDE